MQKLLEYKKSCSRCKEEKSIANFSKSRSGKFRISSECLVCKRKMTKEATRQTKIAGVIAYGGKCMCCGETEIDFLTIDHINGRKTDSKLDRLHGKELWFLLKKLGWPKDNIQLMCFNCNCAKGFLGYCPHELQRMEVQNESHRSSSKNYPD